MTAFTKTETTLTCDWPKKACLNSYSHRGDAGLARLKARDHLGWGRVGNTDICSEHIAAATKLHEAKENNAG